MTELLLFIGLLVVFTVGGWVCNRADERAARRQDPRYFRVR